MTKIAAIPYVVGQWVRGERFYGRGAQLSEILEGPRESVWLLGTRRIGKTSVLKQLEDMTSSGESGYVPLFWDFQGADELEELHLSFHDALLDAEERLAPLGVEISALDPGDLFSSLGRLRRQVRSQGAKVLLLCDEVEELIRLHDQDPSLLRKLRRALQSGEVRSVLASTIRLWALADQRGDTSPFLHGFAPPVYLATLTDEEARALLRQTHLPEASRPALSDEVTEGLRQPCDNHPYLLQLVGKRYLEVGEVEEAVERVATDEMVSYFFAVDFEMLTEIEQEILRAIGEASAASSGSLEERLDLETSQTTGSLLRLEGLGFLRRDPNNRLTLTNTFFKRWLKDLAEQSPVGSQPRTTVRRPEEVLSRKEQLIDGRYEILRQIGEGATGLVHLAHDRLLDVQLAIKILRPEFASQPQILERFRLEIVLSRDLAHPNILRLYHLGQFRGLRYLTMQWVDGPTLGRFLKDQGALAEERVVAIGSKVAAALEAAHAKGVLHRDVKPQNILLDKQSEPLLTDFGLARQVEDPGITTPGMFLGTPHYVSPEQADAKPLDRRTDVYSLGVVLFEMATGERPFHGDSVVEVLEQHRSVDPPHPQLLRPEINDHLAAVILRCLEKDPDKRFSSARELRTNLET